MSDFKTKMHQIRFRLVLRPRHRWELTALPRPSGWIWGPTFKGMGGEGRGGNGRKENGRDLSLRKVNFLLRRWWLINLLVCVLFPIICE